MQSTRKKAIVTGASSGIGTFFARELGRRGYDLILVARRRERLVALAEEIRTAHNVETRTIDLDLNSEDASAKLFEATESQGQAVDVLINNAGMACHGAFLDTPWEGHESELYVNIRAVTQLSYLFGRRMRERGQGYILNVAPIIGCLPVPHYATYAASKAFVRSFSLALADELRNSGVRVSVLCPGGTRTEFFEVAGQKELSFLVRANLADPRDVARAGLDALFKGRRSALPGWIYKLSMFLLRFLPVSAQIASARRLSR